jgi:hypothetical protein
MLDETLLMKEIRQWSSDVLEKPNKKFNNLPACPFAEHSWNKKRVKVVSGEGGLWKDLIQYIQDFDDSYDVIIYCGSDYEEITCEEFKDRLQILLDVVVKKNLYIMGSHPDTVIDYSADQENFESELDEDYYQIYLQRLDTLVKASDSIMKKGYYKNYPNNVLKMLTERRTKWQA